MAFNEKTDWHYNDLVTETDLNRIEKGIGDAHSRVDQMLEDSSTTVPLKHGTQIIEGGNVPAIAFPSIKGRTLVNLMGDAGNGESMNSWSAYPALLTLDSTQKVSGNSSLKLTYNGSAAGNNLASVKFYMPIKDNRRYILIGHIKPNAGTAIIYPISFNGETVTGDYSELVPIISNKSGFNLSVFKFALNPGSTSLAIRLLVSTNGNANFDDIRIYEIDQTEYDGIDSMTSEEIEAKYPYLGTGIHGVSNPTVTNVMDNLLPPITEWSKQNFSSTTSFTSTAAYSGTLFVPDTALRFIQAGGIPVPKNTNLRLKANHNGYIGVYGINTGTLLVPLSETQDVTFNTGDNNVLDVSFSNNTDESGTYTISNIILISGVEDPLFNPQRKTKLILNTELLSSLDGSVADSLEYIDGKVKKTKRLSKLILDGSLLWQFNLDYPGFKRVGLAFPFYGVNESGYNTYTKYDGKVLQFTNSQANMVSSDWGYINSTGGTLITIADADSGWGETYTPTVLEIQAYFNGYKMYNSDIATPAEAQAGGTNKNYNGTGTKGWVNIVGTPMAVGTVGIKSVAIGFIPYQLQYQLTTLVSEDVHISGSVVLEHGENNITVTSKGAPVVTTSLIYADTLYRALKDVEKQQSRILEIMPTIGLKNLLLNSGMAVRQRGDIFTNVNAVYTIDRYNCISIGDSNITIRPSTDVPDRSVEWSARIEQINGISTTTGTYTNFEQKIEDYKSYIEMPMVLTVWAKVDPGVTGNVFLIGAKGTPYVTVNSTSWKKYHVYGVIDPSTNGMSALFRIFRQGIPVGSGMNIAKPVINAGTEPIPFVPRSFAEELALCQRYYEKSYNINDAPGTIINNGALFGTTVDQSNSGLHRASFSFKVRKRVPPTILIYGVAGTLGCVYDGNADRQVTTPGTVTQWISETNFRSEYSIIGATTPLRVFHFTADAEL